MLTLTVSQTRGMMDLALYGSMCDTRAGRALVRLGLAFTYKVGGYALTTAGVQHAIDAGMLSSAWDLEFMYKLHAARVWDYAHAENLGSK